jgi:hypothetical protein
MLDFWIDSCLDMSVQKAEFYSGARKIIRRVRLLYRVKDMSDLKIADCGYTKSKLSMLRRNYYVEESIEAAKKLWDRRLEQKKYGSVGFSCYGHYVKGGGLRNPWELSQAKKTGKPYRASVMGPCIQGVTLTLTEKKSTSIDVFYRTTELFKKWPADLVFIRDQLLPNFNFTTAPVRDIAFHFANVTCHPMYAVTFLAHLDDPVKWLKELKAKDEYFHNWVVKWTARYICKEHSRGIQKFSQALRVGKSAHEMLDKKKLAALQKYCRAVHPGFKNDYEDEDDEE